MTAPHPQPFYHEGRREQNHGKANLLISPFTTTVGCNKRSAVHRDHMADFPPHPQPFSREGRREHTTDALAQTRSPFTPCHDSAFSRVDTLLRG